MMWLRRVAAIPVALVAFVCAVGAGKSFAGLLPDSGAGSGVFLALFAAALLVGTCLLLRPDIRRLRQTPRDRVWGWILTNPLGQAALLYAATAVLMLAAPKYLFLPGFLAVCAFSVRAPWTALQARRWWPHAALAVLGFALLMFALAGTAEALTKGGFGEAGMLFLLPMYIFPILLAIAGLIRWTRRPKTAG
jgi:hypothetical protein